MFRATALLLVAVTLGDASPAPPPIAESTMRMQELRGDSTKDAGASDGDRYVDLHTGFGQMFPGMRVWGDVRSSQWRDAPDWLMGIHTLTVSSIISAGNRMLWECASLSSNNAIPYCDAYVFIYHCPGCDFRDGGLVAQLRGDEWEVFRCSPTVEVDPSTPAHRMLGLYKRVPAGAMEVIDFHEETGLVAFAIERDGKDCADTDKFPDEPACNDPVHKGQCAWVEGSCVLDQCIRFGPPPPEQHCSDRTCLPEEIGALPGDAA